MPIYAYKCSTCGHAADALQKMSADPLTICPACGAATYAKQVTAAGFALKGSGWYVTDFRGGNNGPAKPADGESGAAAEAKPAAAAEANPTTTNATNATNASANKPGSDAAPSTAATKPVTTAPAAAVATTPAPKPSASSAA